MKKLITAAILAGSMVAMAEEAAVVKPAETTPVAAEKQAVKAVKPTITPEMRAARRAKREQLIAQRKAELEKKCLEIIKKYGLDDEKAKALMKELQDAMRPTRRPRPNAKGVAQPAPTTK